MVWAYVKDEEIVRAVKKICVEENRKRGTPKHR